MRRIFTLFLIGLLFFSLNSFSQATTTCTSLTAATCSEVVEPFTTSDGGFTATGFAYSSTNGDFRRSVNGNGIVSSITTRSFTKIGQANTIQAGFDLTKQANQITVTSLLIEVLNASNNVIASCNNITVPNVSPNSICFSLFDNDIANGASLKLRFTFTTSSSNARIFSFDNFRQAGANTTLPVKFVSLSAKQSAAGTLLTWKVAEEEGVKSYQVEKGTNGKNFLMIGSVPASGNSSYTFNDASFAPVSFYRIKSVDIDGKFGYSTIISLKNGKEVVSMRVYPMPAQRQITVQHAMTTNNAKLLISTGDGRLLKSVIPAVGTMQTEVELSNFKAGLYILSFENGNGTKETMKFIKN